MDLRLRQENQSSQWQRLAATMSFAVFLAGPIVAVGVMTDQSRGNATVLVQAPDLDDQSRAKLLIHPPGYIDAGDFAFGYLEYDWDPRGPRGVPGFDSWPPGHPRP